jgi:2-polyprenyl-3-methyl-5-hydroxy-6-metoxy-1,4-benzoquinol methylase
VLFVKKRFTLVQCSFCGLVYVSNPPSEMELEKLYSFASGYHLSFRDNELERQKYLNLAKRHYQLIEKHKTPGRILDIGCSVGFFLQVAKEHTWETYGLEISKDTAELAEQRYGLKVLLERLREDSFLPNFFDVVTLWDVIEHVENPRKTMSIINRILKNDGIVAFSTPNIDGLFPKLSYKVANIIHHWPHPEPPRHLFQFSKKTVHELLQRTGFDVLEMHDERIPISYTFGNSKNPLSSPLKFFYAALFIPIALLGPMVRAGDSLIVLAKKAYAGTATNSSRRDV